MRPPGVPGTQPEPAAEDAYGFRQLFLQLSGAGVSDSDIEPLLPILLASLKSGADPERSAASFVRWFQAVGSPAAHLQTLLVHPSALEIFCRVTGSSQYFADLLARNPEYFEILANPGLRGGLRSAEQYYESAYRLVSACRHIELKRDALRRWKAREMLRVGMRDLVGLADLASTMREFSNLADAAVRIAFEVAAAEMWNSSPPPLAVIAMGKLGGQELNYSSDIDLMFVHGPRAGAAAADPSPDAAALTRMAEHIVRTLSDETASGHAFRVDLRLRPEGRFGPITRSLASFEAYFESWAEPWERQALLKARFVAGDQETGQAFMRLAQRTSYLSPFPPAMAADIRANKRRIEQKCDIEGETEVNVKTGRGGIRDIEFLVQLIQMEHGGRKPRLQQPNTLSAIQRLHRGRLLTGDLMRQLASDYNFLRTLEHRLQLLHGFQTQTLPPPGSAARKSVARRMGFVSPELFEEELELRRGRTRRALEQLFYGPAEPAAVADRDRWSGLTALLDAIDSPTSRQALCGMLAAAGFLNPERGLNALELPMRGNQFGAMPPDTPVKFKAVAPRLLSAAADSVHPDAALEGVEALALAVANRAQLYAALDESPALLTGLVELAAGAPVLMRALARHTEWLDSLFQPEEPDSGDTPEAGHSPGLLPLSAPGQPQQAGVASIGRHYQRERLRIGARFVWGQATVLETARATTCLADQILSALVEAATAAQTGSAVCRLAAIGLGRLGGTDLLFSSDWDLLLVSGQDGPDCQRAAERLLALGSDLADSAGLPQIDLRLRPWGATGSLAYVPQALARYHRSAGETWERQAALKARFAAGDPRLGRRAVRLLQAVCYRAPLTPEQDEEIHGMKARIERERLKPENRDSDPKLGNGGLLDIEWLAQRLQLLHGHARPEIRSANTQEAIRALASAGLLPHEDAAWLEEAAELLMSYRTHIWLQAGASALPQNAGAVRAVARSLGYRAGEEMERGIRTVMAAVREIFLRHFGA